MENQEELLTLIDEIQNILTDLLFSGFNSAHESTAKELKSLSNITKSYGMVYATEKLVNIYESLEKKRHSFNFDYSKSVEDYLKLNQYCIIYKKKLETLKLSHDLKQCSVISNK